jgi:methylated-DNA-[protein]-cysteine S-methyltransferase
MSIEICIENFELGSESISIELTGDRNGLSACRLLSGVSPVRAVPAHPYLRPAIQALRDYFDHKGRDFDVAIAPDGTEFQKRVWSETRRIPYGEVRSYAWLAGQTGNPMGFRAVANALGANPLLLFVPCHRVIKSDGRLGGFSCGVEWKELLLDHEAWSHELVVNRAGASAT